MSILDDDKAPPILIRRLQCIPTDLLALVDCCLGLRNIMVLSRQTIHLWLSFPFSPSSMEYMTTCTYHYPQILLDTKPSWIAPSVTQPIA